MNIDIVYLWCGLPENKRCSYTKDIVYSIKSVHKFIPYCRKIWIIVDDDVSLEDIKVAGIDTQDKKINIVFYKKIIPEVYLPIKWNSNVIECWIWKIRGLSEYFIYLCDDMYIGKMTNIRMFFNNDNLPIIRMDQGNPNHDKLLSHKNTNDYMEMWTNAINEHNIYYTRQSHNCMPYKRSLMKKYYQIYKKEVHKASNNSIRSGKKDFNLLRFTGSLSVMNGEAILKVTNDDYDFFVESNNKKDVKKILKLRPQFFCINNTNSKQYWVYDMLEKYFR